MRRAVFLDRDGVLNQVVLRDGVPRSPLTKAELKIADGVRPALETLKKENFVLIVVTNQPEVARGIQDKRWVEYVHDWLRLELPIDDIRTCFHDNDDRCLCRKPRPGLLVDAASYWNVDTRRSFMVGDRDKDIAAGRGAACRTILLRRAYNRDCRPTPDFACDTFTEAAEWIVFASVGRNRPRREVLKCVSESFSRISFLGAVTSTSFGKSTSSSSTTTCNTRRTTGVTGTESRRRADPAG